MPKHDVNRTAAKESRRKGALAAAAAKRRRRAEAEQIAQERIAGLTDKALDRFEHLLSSEEDSVVFRVVKEVLDRVLGKPTQAAELGLPRYFAPEMLDDDELEQLRVLLEKSQPNGDR
jgi:hypothetical protein